MSTNEVDLEVAPAVEAPQPKKMTAAPRNGQWLKYKLPDPDATQLAAAGAHVTKDGYFLGIYVVGGVDGLGNSHQTRIEPVDGEGLKVRTLAPDKSSVLVAQLDPAGVLELHAMSDRNDVPAKRLATMDPNWNPVA